MKTLSLCLVFMLGFGLAACSEKDVDKIADAQACLDKASPQGADDCVSKVSGIDSQGADLIRCVGKFVREGFNDPSKISDALQAADGQGSDGDASLAMMAAFKFTSYGNTTANKEGANQAFEYCTAAKSKGLIFLSGLAKTSTLFAAIGPVNNAADLEALMTANQGDPDVQEAVGAAANAIYESNCQNGGSSTGEFCQQFESVVSSVGGSNEAVGLCAMQCYTNTPPTGSCTCQGF